MNTLWDAPQKASNGSALNRPGAQGNQGNRMNNKGSGNGSGNGSNKGTNNSNGNKGANTNGNKGSNANGNKGTGNSSNTSGIFGNSSVANSSFVAAPLESIKNAANNVAEVANTAVNKVSNNVANSVNKVMNSDAVNSVTEPIQESIDAMNDSDSFLSMSVILTLGILIILFIVIVIFRDQIAMGFELLWHNIKKLFAPSSVAAEESEKPEESENPEKPKESENPEKPKGSKTIPALIPAPMDPSAINRILPGKKEVFNVAQNKYTYSDAEPLCKAFGAELATYDQVKSAWNKGADWCNYGWIKGQAAVYPTQPSTYNKLQAGPEDQRMACGVVGINGGYFDNPEHRFGVNCYGTKPSENDADIRNIMANPKNMTPGALAYDKKVQDYKHQMGHLPVNPFKEGSWFS